ncbi:MAG: SGNH/GDSL hydrolase family protein [Ornithinimicrobium sp.]|uniref:SGNH/GDSL hydrolase family protein n=1 Tax=Ornithinimicrobium sp. TaxID=1977084 RepID=UPI0026E0ACE2|nr:SGNH/GDSL hydrolase family protein [Ornithinimicrobium sp.]MDO5740581.1 SGNH/GDSL hydrolase family protein [Ornithinimicrobium sp.]
MDRRSGSIHPLPRDWTRYVAIGDSFTEGMSDLDPQRPGSYVGWADRLSSLLAPHVEEFSYANLAVRGRKLADVAGPQLEAALALQPELVSIVGGGNDILRPKADVDALAAQLEAAVARIRATGADVLMATPTDPAGAPIIGRTRGRAATYVAHLWSIAQRHDCYVLNLWGCDFLHDWRMWAEDRLHLTPEGHRRIALAAYSALGHDPADAQWQVPLPPQAPAGALATARETAAWAKEYGAPWVQRRLQGRSSGDHLSAKRPALTRVDPPGPPRT